MRDAKRHHWWVALGTFLLFVTAILLGYPLLWEHHSHTVGAVLAQRAASVQGSRSGRCGTALAVGTRSHPGILAIPAIGLVAPVIGGVSNSVLSVAVGHDPATVWPGSSGESVLLAHDVSYFSGLDHVKVGDTVIWTLGCQRVVFRVTGAKVVQPGHRIPVPANGVGLSLVTCWPTNALFWTPSRYLVETRLVRRERLHQRSSVMPPALVKLRVPAPPALAAQGLTARQSGVFVGELTISGTPSRTFSQGPQPLAVAASALREYVAAAKTAVAANRVWWHAIAEKGVQMPSAWVLTDVTDVTLQVSGGRVRGAQVTSVAATVTMTVRDGTLWVAGVSVRVPSGTS